jgi:N,N'-diacetyllegionaminate synthase
LAIPSIHQVVLATSILEDDLILESYCCEGKVDFWRGDPDDVISRYLGACDHFGIDVVVRITADCPVISTEIAEYLLNQHFANGADYTAAADAAVGTAAEVINVSALRRVIAMLGRAEYSEYMTWYFRNNPDIFRVNIVDLPSEMIRPYRLTLDHQEDFVLFDALYDALDSDGTAAVALSDVFRHLDARPEIAALNSHIQLKYKVDQELISLLNEKTRIRVSS